MFLTPQGGNGAFTALFQLLLLEQSAHFRASARKHPGGKDRQRILATQPTNHRQTKKSSGFHGLKGKNSLRHSAGYFQTSSPLICDLFGFSNCILCSADSFTHCIHFCSSCFCHFILLWWNVLSKQMRKGYRTACCTIKGQHIQTGGH